MLSYDVINTTVNEVKNDSKMQTAHCFKSKYSMNEATYERAVKSFQQLFLKLFQVKPTKFLLPVLVVIHFCSY